MGDFKFVGLGFRGSSAGFGIEDFVLLRIGFDQLPLHEVCISL